MARRGPDADGIATWPGAVLGHRRLAIFDLSDAGRQPMLSEDREIGIVFNGAIYNFLPLRKELETLGFEFRSHCDTEVILNGYRAWGLDDLLTRIRGMFAIAIWDNRRQTLFLVRDRLGVKPLHYAVSDGKLAFASTADALHRTGLLGDLNPRAVLEYLEFGFVTDAEGIFAGSSKVSAGEIVEWHAGKISRRTYWRIPDIEESLRITFDEAVEETEKLLLDAVRDRLDADVPVGALLSGGIDSGLICWGMAKLNANITAFTVGVAGDSSDETADAAHTAARLGIPHRVVELNSDGAAGAEDVAAAFGEPFGCPSALGMLEVSRAVKPYATVLLTGDGGDDVFLGYPFHRHFWMAQRLARALPDFASPLWRGVRKSIAGADFLRRPRHFVDYATGGLGAITRVHDGLPYYRRMGLLGERLASGEIPQREIPLDKIPARHLLSDFLPYEQRTRFVGEFMTKVDGGTMHYAIEARSPLLDHRLWDFAARLPPSIRLQGGQLKAILREIANRRIGPQTANRRKRGFTVPVQRWLTGRWKQELDEICSAPILETEGWLSPGAMRRSVEAAAAGGAPTQLWYLVVLERWMRRQRLPNALERT
jgi:asparagine synthase (glutamine-hydrolysing)